MQKPKLGDLLVEANLIDEVQMRIALEEQKRWGTKFGSTLIALHFIDENVLTAFLSKQLDIPCISLTNIEIHDNVLERLTSELAHKYHAVPIRAEAGKLYTAMADPMDMDAIEALEEGTDEHDSISLDSDRKATFASNLMTVIASDHPTTPVVNVGTLSR